MGDRREVVAKLNLKISRLSILPCQNHAHADLSPAGVICAFGGKNYASGGTLHAKNVRNRRLHPICRASLKLAHYHWVVCRIACKRMHAMVRSYKLRTIVLRGSNEVRDKRTTTLIALRLPDDILAQLPAPSGYRTGKSGTGRAGVIVDLLRQALKEHSPENESSSPGCSSN